MTTQNIPTIDIQVIDEHTTFTAIELCRYCGVEATFIDALVEEGILEPEAGRGRQPRYPAVSLRRTRTTLRLQRDLGVNLAGAALAIELLERIEKLDARLQALRNAEAGQ